MVFPGTKPPLKHRFLVLAVLFIAACWIMAPSVPGAADGSHLLLWPLPFRSGCSSSFGEYRETHFHGGIDITTRRTIGWPCLAVADGRVVRIRREPGGYGRVLYLRLDDGRTAVYGHVCRFDSRVTLAKQAIEDGRLGRIVSMHARRNLPRVAGSVRLDKISPLMGDGVRSEEHTSELQSH